MRLKYSLPVALAVLGLVTGPINGQTTYTWANNPGATATTGNGFFTGTNPFQNTNPVALSNPGGQNTDSVQFVGAFGGPNTALGAFAQSTVNPTLVSNLAAGSMNFANTQQFGGFQVTGSGAASTALVVGGASSTGLTTRGTATTRLTNVGLSGAGAVTQLTFNLGNGSTLLFDGDTALGTNIGTALTTGSAFIGGTVTLDNTTTNVNARLGTAGLGTFGSGTLNLIGNSGGTAATVGNQPGSNSAGVITYRVTSTGGGGASLSFANAGSTRLSTFSIQRFEAGNGTLGGALASDPKIFYSATPTLGNGGLLAAGATTSGYAVVVNGGVVTDFAGYGANGVQAVGSTLTASTVANLQTATNTTTALYNPGAGTQTATANVTAADLRLAPTAAGAVLDMATFNVQTSGLMLVGTTDFTLNGTGTFSLGIATRYIHVADPNTTLSTSLLISSGTNPTGIAGPGFLVLTGAVNQNTITGANRVDLHGGTLRANNTQFGFAATGGNGSLNFRGGVLEITGGTNAAGGDFARPVNAANTAGAVRWEGGGGGFSAFGSAASVNLGGAGAPLTWAAGGFVGDGYPLLFGSTKSDAAITFLNPIALDGGTAGLYTAREVRVLSIIPTAPAVLAGLVSGTATTDLLKTGPGVLSLTNANTYAGQTLVQAGTLRLGAGGSLPNTRTISVNAGATFDVAPAGGITLASGQTLKGTGTVSGAVTLNSGAALFPGLSPGTLTVTGGTTTFNSGSSFRVSVASAAAAAGGVNTGTSATAGVGNSLLAAGASGITFSAGTNLIVDLTGVTLVPTSTYSFQVATGTGISPAGPTAPVSVGGYTFLNGSSDVTASITGQFTPTLVVTNGTAAYLNLVPVPEPATVLAAAAVGLGGLRLVRRRIVGS